MHSRRRQSAQKRRPTPLALILGALMLGAFISSPWLVAVWIKPVSIPDKSVTKIHRPPIQRPVSANQAALLSAIANHDRLEKGRAKKVRNTRHELSRIKAATRRELQRESAQIARRIVDPALAMKLGVAKAQDSLPRWLVGDPRAGERVLLEAIGPKSVELHARARDQALDSLAALTGKSPTPASRHAIRKSTAINSEFSRRLVRQTSQEFRKIARNAGSRVLKRAAGKAPAAAADGPLPAVEIALFFSTIFDIYQQGGVARSAARKSVYEIARKENLAALDQSVQQVDQQVVSFDRADRIQNCKRLRSVYDRSPIHSLKGRLLQRC